MELKFHVFILLVIFTVFGTIEAGRFGGGSRSRSSTSSGRTSSSRRPSSTSHSTSHSTSYRPSSTGHFLNAERGHSSSSGRHPSSSGSDPYRGASAPSLSTHGSSGSSNPFRPFATVPPPRHSGSGSSGSSNPFRPFATVPPPRHSGSGSSGSSNPFRPFATVPPPRHSGYPSPVTPPPIGFINPGSRTPSRPNTPLTSTGNHPGSTDTRPRPVVPFGHRNLSSSYRPPQSGSNIPRYTTARPLTHGSYNNSRGGGYNPGSNIQQHTTARPLTHGSYNNSRGGGYNPVIQAKPYPTQGYHPGGVTYPHQQPPYNPAYPNYHQPIYNPAYPGYSQVPPVYTQPNPNHVYHQSGASLPPNPSHTVIVVPGQSNYGSYGRSTGDIFKEALIHAGVNAAVHRITSPGHYYDNYHHNSWNSYGTPPQGGSVSTTNTHTVTNNYYGQSTGGLPNNGGGSTLLPYNPTQNYPVGGVQDGSLPPNGNYPNMNNGNPGSQGSPGPQASPGFTANPVNPQLPSNGQSYVSQNGAKDQPKPENLNWPGGISDEQLRNITEKLFAMDETVYKFISINLQNQTAQNNTNVTDASPQPLFSIHPDAYQVPTIQAIRTLYEINFAIENKTRDSSRKEEALLVDIILNTNVMITAMQFLAQKNLIKNDYFEHKDFLKRIWFTPYDGSSSGFKRVFQGEVVAGEILYGIQDWIAFDFHERSKRANYLSYTEKIELGENATILKINFEMSGIKKLGTGILVGTSPELEMALYTICHYARPNNYCVVSLGGTQFSIYTHTFRYFGHDLIDLAFPLI